MDTLKIAEQLQKLTVVQLKEKCRAAGLRQPDKPSAGPTTTAKPTKAATASTHRSVSTAKRTTTKEKALSSEKTASKDGGKPTKGKVEVTAKKRALTQKGAQETEKKNETRLTYVVWSSDDYLDDGWHSYDGPGDRNVDSEHTSKQKAIARVRQLFFQENPWGLTEKEMRGEEIEESTAGGLLSLSVAPPDSSCWTVCAQPKAEFLREQAQRKSEFDEDESQSDVDGEEEDDCSSEDESDADSRGYGSEKKKYRSAAEQVW